jgi:hypothetical protein
MTIVRCSPARTRDVSSFSVTPTSGRVGTVATGVVSDPPAWADPQWFYFWGDAFTVETGPVAHHTYRTPGDWDTFVIIEGSGIGAGVLVGLPYSSGYAVLDSDGFPASNRFQPAPDPTSWFYTDGTYWYFCAAGTGVYRSSDDSTWTLFTDVGVPLDLLPSGSRVFKLDDGKFYAFGSSTGPNVRPFDTILRSDDGIVWEILNVTHDTAHGADFVFLAGPGWDAGGIVAVGVDVLTLGLATDTWVYYGGATEGWQRVASWPAALQYDSTHRYFGFPLGLVYDASHGAYVIVGGWQGAHDFTPVSTFMRSTDGGASWSIVPTLIDVEFSLSTTLYSPSDAAIYQTASANAATCLWRSTDGGLTWASLPTPFDGFVGMYLGDGSGAWSLGIIEGTLDGVTAPMLLIAGVPPSTVGRTSVQDANDEQFWARPLAGGAWTQLDVPLTGTGYSLNFSLQFTTGGPVFRFLELIGNDVDISGAIPQRQFPRDDGLGISARRSWPPPTSKQFGQRRGASATYE